MSLKPENKFFRKLSRTTQISPRILCRAPGRMEGKVEANKRRHPCCVLWCFVQVSEQLPLWALLTAPVLLLIQCGQLTSWVHDAEQPALWEQLAKSIRSVRFCSTPMAINTSGIGFQKAIDVVVLNCVFRPFDTRMLELHILPDPWSQHCTSLDPHHCYLCCDYPSIMGHISQVYQSYVAFIKQNSTPVSSLITQSKNICRLAKHHRYWEIPQFAFFIREKLEIELAFHFILEIGVSATN